jgi:hypothetical protein
MLHVRTFSMALVGLVLFSVTGCDSLLHNLKPHRLWHMNRHSPPMAAGSSPYYSVPDPPIGQAVSEKLREPDWHEPPLAPASF